MLFLIAILMVWGCISWFWFAFAPPLLTLSACGPPALAEPLLWGSVPTGLSCRHQLSPKARSIPERQWFYERCFPPLQVNLKAKSQPCLGCLEGRPLPSGNTAASPSLGCLTEARHLSEVKEGWQRPRAQGSASEETWGPAGSRDPHSPVCAVLFSAGLSWCHLEPIQNTWVNFPRALSPQEFILIILEPCLRLPGYIFGKFDVSLIHSCLETAICVRYTVTTVSKPKIRRLSLARQVHLWGRRTFKSGTPPGKPRGVHSLTKLTNRMGFGWLTSPSAQSWA